MRPNVLLFFMLVAVAFVLDLAAATERGAGGAIAGGVAGAVVGSKLQNHHRKKKAHKAKKAHKTHKSK